MFVFGLDLPLVEILFVLVILFIVCLVLILSHLRKLETMTTEEKAELRELEQIATEERQDIQKLSGFENTENIEMERFERNIKALEYDSDTIYMKKIAPDMYKLQNYVIWSLRKGIAPEKIKENLESRGWTDKALVKMVVDDMAKYMKYTVTPPETTLETQKTEESKPLITQTNISITAPSEIPKQKPVKKASYSIKSVEKEIKALEKDIKKESKNKPSPTKKTVRTSTHKAEKKAPKTKPSANLKSKSNKADDIVVASKSGDKFHKSTCIAIKKVHKDRIKSFKDNREAIKAGYKPCEVCSIKAN